MSVYDTMVAGLSGAGLVLLGFVTSHGASEYHLNAFQMEAALATNAAAALEQAGHDWAKVRFVGQKATLSGSAPGQSEIDLAEATILQSSGKGGLLYGGVLDVEVNADIAPPEPDDALVYRPDPSSPDTIDTISEETDIVVAGENLEGSE
ncbi:MAG: hypothetical protein Hens3KO_22400 [Henriciella sp.]